MRMIVNDGRQMGFLPKGDSVLARGTVSSGRWILIAFFLLLLAKKKMTKKLLLSLALYVMEYRFLIWVR